MDSVVRIQMMGNYLIFVDERKVENPVSKSRKGAALMSFLILNGGHQVPNQRLLRALWPGNTATNPENALKTLVSRVRSMLNQIADGLGGCVVSDRGAYHWENKPWVKIDLNEITEIFADLARERDEAVLEDCYRRLLELYKGDLYQTGDLDKEAAYAEQLHGQYLSAMYDYIELLKRGEKYNEISAVCRTALEVDSFDDHLHIELMKAMVNLNRTSDALSQYKYATNMTYRYLGAERSAFFVPSDLEQRLATSGSRERYQVQFERFGKMDVPDSRLLPLVSLLHRHQKGYDQEGYITGSDNYE